MGDSFCYNIILLLHSLNNLCDFRTVNYFPNLVNPILRFFISREGWVEFDLRYMFRSIQYLYFFLISNN